jgi:uncharacterized protein (UPF0332 family)
MGLAEDLLAQAHHLASLDRNRPKQANLRRAISSAYYSVFHLLVANAALKFIPRRPAGLIPRVSRAFLHGEMKQACFAFKRTPLADPLNGLLGGVVSPDIEALATAFISLQEVRHIADYDTGTVFSRSGTLAIIAKAEATFSHWRSIEGTDEATVFLATLAFGARWSK